MMAMITPSENQMWGEERNDQESGVMEREDLMEC
jgi:hypothetical protein